MSDQTATIPAPIAKPLYASVGAGQAAYAAATQAVRSQAKELPELLKTLPARASGLQSRATTRATGAPAQVRLHLDELRGYATGLPGTVITLPQEVAERFAALQQDATARLGKVQETVTASYDDYATRGQQLVAALRGESPDVVAPA